MPLVSNTGPLPEVFGAGTFTPFSRMQVANFASAAWKAGLLKRAPPPRPANLPPPHFFSAASYLALFTPFGSWRPLAPPNGPRACGCPCWPGLKAGSVTPFFCRHSRTAAKRPAFAPLAPVPVPVLALVVAVVPDELLEEPPQAASPRQASRRTSTVAAAAAGLRLMLSV